MRQDKLVDSTSLSDKSPVAKWEAKDEAVSISKLCSFFHLYANLALSLSQSQ